MRSTFWLATSAVALLLAVVAVLGLRGTAPPIGAILDPPATTQAAHAAVPAPAPAPLDRPPSFDIVKVDPSGQAVIAGRAAPGARVRVLDGDTPIGEATADARGEWVVVPKAPLTPGERQLIIEATGRVTGAARRSDDVVALSVAPPDRKGASLAVLLPGDPDQPPRVLQRPDATAAAGGLSLDTAGFDASGRLLLSGRAGPGAHLSLYAGNQPLGKAIADAAGKWSAVAPHPQSSGPLDLRIDQLNADGTVAHRIAQAFAPPPTSAEGGRYRYLVKRGNTLWWIARQTYGEGVRYTAIYAVNRDNIRDPNLIYPGQLFKLPQP
ncbi:MAG TPA: LysM peptidoglycan-binding domain-containing protein [Stellaceae bacterium]|nr:LysM peptidoglycan-binding domain-containing protein [Stellaceae bacterium]